MTRKEREDRAAAASGSLPKPKFGELAGGTAGSRSKGRGAAASAAVQVSTRSYLEQLSQRDDGWLRWTRKRDTDTVFAKWKFTEGRHRLHYVMAVGQWWQVDYVFAILLAKLAKVDAGDTSDLARDTVYNHLNDEVSND